MVRGNCFQFCYSGVCGAGYRVCVCVCGMASACVRACGTHKILITVSENLFAAGDESSFAEPSRTDPANALHNILKAEATRLSLLPIPICNCRYIRLYK